MHYLYGHVYVFFSVILLFDVISKLFIYWNVWSICNTEQFIKILCKYTFKSTKCKQNGRICYSINLDVFLYNLT